MTKILVIEDDIFVQHTIKRALELHKIPVEVVNDGLEGVEKAALIKPRVILLNVMLTKINGLEVLKKIKSSEKTKDIPVIVLINFTEEELIKKAKSLGAVDCIIKSEFTPDAIVDKVNAYL
jgi:CheY-like chemotaxis protein